MNKCKYCEKCFEGKSMGAHVTSAHHRRKKKLCEVCGKEFLFLRLHKCKGIPKQQSGFCEKCNTIIKQRFYHHIEKCDGIKREERYKRYHHKTNFREHGWNKGLTKETNKNVKQTGETFSKRIKLGLIVPGFKNKNQSETSKKQISIGMIKAHEDGRAYYLGKRGIPSYPEKIFKEIIENEFEDKKFLTEYHILSYYLDFAWPEKKKAIEIDGELHYRGNNKENDNKRDNKICNLGWQMLRIRWKDFLKDGRPLIEKAKEFIGK